MSTTKEKMVKSTSKELEQVIEKAMKKIGGSKENDICRYLPVEPEGYMHHFTLRKMKNEGPEELCKMIKKFIINVDKPKTVPPKPRAARGSRKRREQISFTRSDLEHMLRIARIAGDKELIRKLTPKRDLRAVKRDLIASIRHSRVEPELWNSYCEIIAHQNQPKSEEDAQLAETYRKNLAAHKSS